ncbi:hypothetical protein PBRA_006085 [Plasmodiophora brassicae]|uniref:Uncharacterized protein n=1 Tax=Plasmodiophora brassicae TaxID=37360 RepID=A0A0G4IS81_PLABS|nr:hypothetical protein PBRA_006085 [Plasmodiophora brassicae]
MNRSRMNRRSLVTVTIRFCMQRMRIDTDDRPRMTSNVFSGHLSMSWLCPIWVVMRTALMASRTTTTIASCSQEPELNEDRQVQVALVVGLAGELPEHVGQAHDDNDHGQGQADQQA